MSQEVKPGLIETYRNYEAQVKEWQDCNQTTVKVMKYMAWAILTLTVIGGIIAVGFLIHHHWDTIHDHLSRAWTAVSHVGDQIGAGLLGGGAVGGLFLGIYGIYRWLSGSTEEKKDVKKDEKPVSHDVPINPQEEETDADDVSALLKGSNLSFEPEQIKHLYSPEDMQNFLNVKDIKPKEKHDQILLTDEDLLKDDRLVNPLSKPKQIVLPSENKQPVPVVNTTTPVSTQPVSRFKPPEGQDFNDWGKQSMIIRSGPAKTLPNKKAIKVSKKGNGLKENEAKTKRQIEAIQKGEKLETTGMTVPLSAEDLK